MSESLIHPVLIDPYPRNRGGVVKCEQCPYYIFNYQAPHNRPLTCAGTSYIAEPINAFSPAVVYGVVSDESASSLASKIMYDNALCEPNECI